MSDQQGWPPPHGGGYGGGPSRQPDGGSSDAAGGGSPAQPAGQQAGQPYGQPAPGAFPAYPAPAAQPDPAAGAGGNQSASRGPSLLVTIGAALLAGLVGGAGAYLVLDGGGSSASRVEPLPQAEVDDSPPAEGSIAAVVDEVLPSVVTIEVAAGSVGASGSGFVIDEQGHVLTNNHVISPAVDGGSITVVLSDGSAVPADLIGRNDSYDLAVLQIDRGDLTVAALGNSDSVDVGDTAIAIGAPLGLSETVTSGIISALDRPVTAGGQGELAFINAIQTDAAINPGNSGGPLLNAGGEVIGVNSAIATLAGRGEESGSIGLGFSIPINQAKRIADEIIATGVSTTPAIGVSVDLRYLGPGARISAVEPGGPADQAGLEAGDVVVEVDGQPVADATEFIVALRSNAPGDTVELTLQGGETVEVRLEGRSDL